MKPRCLSVTKNELQQRTAKVKAAMSVASTALDDKTALNAIAIFPMWNTDSEYAVGNRVQHKNNTNSKNNKTT